MSYITKHKNTFIRNIYATDGSSLRISFYYTYLNLGFTPAVWENNVGRTILDVKQFMSTSVDYNNASALYLAAHEIIFVNENQPLHLTLDCQKQATLHLDYSMKNGQMAATLAIEKQNRYITIEFQARPIKYKNQNGQVCEKLIQSGLGNFMCVLEGYLRGIGADNHLNKFSDDDLETAFDPVKLI